MAVLIKNPKLRSRCCCQFQQLEPKVQMRLSLEKNRLFLRPQAGAYSRKMCDTSLRISDINLEQSFWDSLVFEGSV